MVVHDDPPLTDCSQRITLPVWPANVSDPLLLPVHTVVDPVTAPPAETALTVIVETDEYSIHVPDVILARYCVVVVKLVYGTVVVVFAMLLQVPPPLTE